ncbi:MAG TPA: hypothetical protein ENJ60_00975 [Aeromonadales bacterium]|nr:hypothetical protein [Aeromonadales bacterium]
MERTLFLSNNNRQTVRLVLAMLVTGCVIFTQSLPSQAQSIFNPAQKRTIKVPGVSVKGKLKSSKGLTRVNTIRTRTLTITGADGKTNQVAVFKPVRIKTKILTIEGKGNETTAVKAFTPVNITTRKLTITGTQSSPEINVANISQQTNVFGSPANTPVRLGSLNKSNTIRTRLLTITGKDSQSNQVASFTPVGIKTQLLTITGSGTDANTIAPFTPKNIRTKILTITGKSSGKH